jgi:hypothetical protein
MIEKNLVYGLINDQSIPTESSELLLLVNKCS